MKYMSESQKKKHEDICYRTMTEALGEYMFKLIEWFDEESEDKADFKGRCMVTLKGMEEYAAACRRNGVFK